MAERKCKIVSRSDESYCLQLAGLGDDNRNLPEDGTKVHLWKQKDDGHLNQEWLWDGKYIKSCKSSHYCIHLNIDHDGNPSDGTTVHVLLSKSKPHKNQEWHFESRDDGYVNIRNSKDTDRCLHLKGKGKPSNGTVVHLWKGMSSPSSQWKIVWLN